jgi:hypothetical protein
MYLQFQHRVLMQDEHCRDITEKICYKSTDK